MVTISDLTQLRKVNWRKVKTVTISSCDPATCKCQACPAQTKNNLPIRGETVPDGPGVLVIECNQDGQVARLLKFLNDLMVRR